MNQVQENAEFEVCPSPIPASEINRIETTDVVVVGAGVSGLTAAASAAEAGAEVILLEKGETYHFRGLHNAALSSRLQKQAGITVDRNELIHTIMEFATYRSDQRLINLWADNCDHVMDWLLDLSEAAGIEVMLDPTTKPWYFPNYPIIHVFKPKQQETLVQMLLDYGRKLGVNVIWNSPAIRLLREERGRITGVIARDQQGTVVQYNVRKAVVLSTGDYGNDPDMVRHYCRPAVHDLKVVYEPTVNTGDGHKMAMWTGAAMDDTPHCAMIWDFAWFSKGGLFNLSRQPWLYVNSEGERFMDEDLPYGYECNQILRQPESFAWSIWDAKYEDEWPRMQSQCCKNMGPPTDLWSPKQLEEALAAGNVITASTLESLAAKMNVPTATFTATVSRYNELVKSGVDKDFGKHPDRLTSLEMPLYYACKMETRRMVVLSGLTINTRLQVLDTDRHVIPGLYASGNVSGSFFGDSYPSTVPGLTHSRAWTFGRLAGQNAAALKHYDKQPE